jgi:hypothetical protein
MTRPTRAILVLAAVGVAGCAAGTTIAPTTTRSSTPSTSSSTAPAPTTSTTVIPPTTTSTVPVAQNLVVSTEVRNQLLTAGAAFVKVPLSELSGLVPGRTFYAIDHATATYWAGAKLAGSSMDVAVATQDQNAYLLFTQASGAAAWTVYGVGLSFPGLGGAPCPVEVPIAVLQVWGWAPGTCRPESIS